MRKLSSRPTEAELSILAVLWERGPCAVRDVHEVLQAEQSTGYTTTLKLLQLMHAKGLVIRDETQRAHIYAAAVARNKVETQMVGELVSKLFGGSSSRLVLQALGSGSPASKREIAEMKALLDELELRQ